MDFSLIANLRKLVEGFKNFDLKSTPTYLRIIADIFDKAKDIFDAFVKPTIGEEGADFGDDELAAEILSYIENEEKGIASFDPTKLLLVVELIVRIFDRLKK